MLEISQPCSFAAELAGPGRNAGAMFNFGNVGTNLLLRVEAKTVPLLHLASFVYAPKYLCTWDYPSGSDGPLSDGMDAIIVCFSCMTVRLLSWLKGLGKRY